MWYIYSMTKSESADFLAIVRAETSAADMKAIWAQIIADAKAGDNKARDLVLKYMIPDVIAEAIQDDRFKRVVFTIEKPDGS